VDHGAFESQHAADGSGYAHAALRVVCATHQLLESELLIVDFRPKPVSLLGRKQTFNNMLTLESF
jgi:hypothetical protein